MFNLFKKQNDIIEQIHREFNTAGDRLLAETKQILSGMTVSNEDKANRLKSCGFTRVSELVETDRARSAKKSKQDITEAIEYFAIHYPQYKFITHDMAVDICNKYNLVIGEVGLYRGFVPEKNLQQIELFWKEENEINTIFFREYRRHAYRTAINKSEYDLGDKSSNSESIYSKYRKTLYIAAPQKDMDTSGHKLRGRFLVRDIPDPVVMAPIKRNNIQFYCIITAWGDEASDEMVVNQISN